MSILHPLGYCTAWDLDLFTEIREDSNKFERAHLRKTGIDFMHVVKEKSFSKILIEHENRAADLQRDFKRLAHFFVQYLNRFAQSSLILQFHQKAQVSGLQFLHNLTYFSS